jgi:hypothetical protein
MALVRMVGNTAKADNAAAFFKNNRLDASFGLFIFRLLVGLNLIGTNLATILTLATLRFKLLNHTLHGEKEADKKGGGAWSQPHAPPPMPE